MKNIYEYNFYIGNNGKDTKEHNERIEQYAIEYFDNFFPAGYTLTNAMGRYAHGNGSTVKEKTSIFTVFTTYELIEIELMQAQLKELCNKEDILITVSKTKVL